MWPLIRSILRRLRTGIIVLLVVLLSKQFLFHDGSRSKEISRRAACGARLASLGRAIMSDSASNPAIRQDALDIWQSRAATHRCPNAAQSNYVLRLPDPSSNNLDAATVLAYEPIWNHGEGGNILFLDGHVKWCSRAEYEQLLAPHPNPASKPS